MGVTKSVDFTDPPRGETAGPPRKSNDGYFSVFWVHMVKDVYSRFHLESQGTKYLGRFCGCVDVGLARPHETKRNSAFHLQPFVVPCTPSS